MEDGADEAAEEAPVTALIRTVASAAGRSYRKIAAEAVDPVTGEQLDYRYINDIARGKVASAPSPARVRALAAGLGVDVDDLKQLAAVQWLDVRIETRHPREGEIQLWSTVRQLSEEDLEAVQMLAQSLLERHRRRKT